MKIALMRRSTARGSEVECGGDRGIARAVGQQSEHLRLAGGQAVEALTRRHLRPEHHPGDLRVEHRPLARDGLDGVEQERAVGDALLEDVGPAGARHLEESARVGELRVLAEHDDADLGMRAAELGGEPDSLVRPGRRHPDVGHDDVRPRLLDRLVERVVVGAGADDLGPAGILERADDPLSHEIRVVADDDAQRPCRAHWFFDLPCSPQAADPPSVYSLKRLSASPRRRGGLSPAARCRLCHRDVP